MPALLELDSITKRYGTVTALENVSLSVDAGEFVTLVGPSGSGKSTALMAIAGFVAPDSGRILHNGADITGTAPERRGFGVVFQGYALFPHLTVARNIAYPLEVRGLPRSEIESRVRHALDLVQLEGVEDRRPAMLSGGQQQRVAIARALVYEPPLLLLDEPLSALDRKLRSELQSELKALHARLGTTFVNITHDQEEALTLSTRVVVLSKGRVMQAGSPSDLYERPHSGFVADFLGNANLLRVTNLRPPGQLSADEAFCCGALGDAEVRFALRHPLREAGTGRDAGSALIAVRPEAIGIRAQHGRDVNTLTGIVRDVARVGSLLRISLVIDGGGSVKIVSTDRESASPAQGETLTRYWRIEDTVHVSTEES